VTKINVIFSFGREKAKSDEGPSQERKQGGESPILTALNPHTSPLLSLTSLSLGNTKSCTKNSSVQPKVKNS